MTLAAMWLRTHRVRHLYIQHAWTLPLRVVEEVLALLSRTDLTLWLVGDTPFTDAHAEVLALWTAESFTGEEFTAAWTNLPDSGTEGSAALKAALTPASWPQRLPDDDFTTFRAACRDLLTPAQFGVVDAYFRRQVVVNRAAIAGMVERGELDEERIAAWLADHWESATSMAQYLTFIRAAQVAIFLAGHYLQVDLDQLISTASVMPRRALRTSETWARLHAYPEPHRAAVCALAGAGVSVAAIAQVTVGGCHPDTSAITLADGEEVTVEPDARVFLTAQWHLRQLQGATDDALLFPTRAGGTLSASSLVQVINDARRELGVAVAPARIGRKPSTGDRWITRWGISIQELL